MKQLEIIEFRSDSGEEEKMKISLGELFLNLRKNHPAVRFFRNAYVESDYSFHIEHQSKNVPPTGSAEAELLISALNDFGMVHHTIWSEMEVKS